MAAGELLYRVYRGLMAATATVMPFITSPRSYKGKFMPTTTTNRDAWHHWAKWNAKYQALPGVGVTMILINRQLSKSVTLASLGL
jgi:hypothetical protein